MKNAAKGDEYLTETNLIFCPYSVFCTHPVEKRHTNSGLPLNWHGINVR